MSRSKVFACIGSFTCDISRIDYGISLYVSLPSYLLKKLQLVRNRSCRLIYYLLSCVPTTVLHILLNCTDSLWRQELSFKICLLAFKAVKFGEPRYLCWAFKPVHMDMGLRTFDNPFWLAVLRATSEQSFSEWAFSYIATRLLNRLAVSLKELILSRHLNLNWRHHVWKSI